MKTLSVLIVIFLALLLLSVGAAQAASIERSTVFILDTSGSGGGQGVATATDGHGLRDGVLRELLVTSWLTATEKPPVAVITCSDRPEILLQPTADPTIVEEFARTLYTTASGGTSIDATLELLQMMEGQPANIIYIGDGLLTRPNTSSKRIVAGLPAVLKKLYGTRPELHVIAVDSSEKVFSRTRAEWSAAAGGRIAEVGQLSDVPAAVKATARNLNWTGSVTAPNVLATKTSPRRWLWIGSAVASLLALFAALKLRGGRSRLNALITIEEDGRSRRTSASAFRKTELSIGDAGCDVKVPKWKEPIRLVQKVVRDRRGRKRQQTIAQQGTRSVILGRVPASFSDGKTTIRVRGGRR